MIHLNLQYFGGRGNSGTRGGAGSSTTSGSVSQITSKEVDKATFKKDLVGQYHAAFGTMTDAYGDQINDAVEMRIIPRREDGRTFYTTRFIVKGGGRDWQYNDTEYYTLNSAKSNVKTDVKDYLNSLNPRSATKLTAANPNKKPRTTKQPTWEEQLASTRERAQRLSTSMELRKAYRTSSSKEERKIYADELKRRGYKVPRGNIYHTNA